MENAGTRTATARTDASGRPAPEEPTGGRPFVDAGFDRLALLNAGPDRDGFLDFFAYGLAEPIRKLTPRS